MQYNDLLDLRPEMYIGDAEDLAELFLRYQEMPLNRATFIQLRAMRKFTTAQDLGTRHEAYTTLRGLFSIDDQQKELRLIGNFFTAEQMKELRLPGLFIVVYQKLAEHYLKEIREYIGTTIFQGEGKPYWHILSGDQPVPDWAINVKKFD